MKKTLLFGLLISFAIGSAFSQEQQVPNGGFEDWDDSQGYLNPVGWDSSNKGTSFVGVNIVKDTTDAASGSMSAFLGSHIIPPYVIPGAMTLGSFDIDYQTFSATMNGGIPFTDRPLSLKGSYKNYPAAGDSTTIVTIFTKWMPAKGKRDTIGFGGMYSKETIDTWTTFSIPIYFFNEDDAPDTMNIIVVSSNMLNPNKDSYMFIDNLSFEYPAGINEQEFLIETSVFPNPATDKVTFSFEKDIRAEIQIYSNDGQLVYTTFVDGNKQKADLSQLSSGTYYYSVLEGNKKLSSGKIILNK